MLKVSANGLRLCCRHQRIENRGVLVGLLKETGRVLAVAAVVLMVVSCASRKDIVQGKEEFSIDQDLYREALKLQDDGLRFKAIRAWKELLEDEPRFALGHLHLGQIYDDMNQLPDAVASYERSVRHDDSNGVAFLNLGAAYLRSGRINPAEKALLRAFELDKYRPELRFTLSAFYMKVKNYDEALMHADAAVDLLAVPDKKQESGLATSVNRDKLGLYLIRQGECHLERGEAEKATIALDRAEKQCHVKIPKDLRDRLEDLNASTATEEPTEDG